MEDCNSNSNCNLQDPAPLSLCLPSNTGLPPRLAGRLLSSTNRFVLHHATAVDHALGGAREDVVVLQFLEQLLRDGDRTAPVIWAI
jgi:hypothetical protein